MYGQLVVATKVLDEELHKLIKYIGFIEITDSRIYQTVLWTDYSVERGN